MIVGMPQEHGNSIENRLWRALDRSLPVAARLEAVPVSGERGGERSRERRVSIAAELRAGGPFWGAC